MTTESFEFTTPVGRLISGSAFESVNTDFEGNPLLYKSGPKIGQPREKWTAGIAIPKTDAGFNEAWAGMNAIARAAFPQLFDAQGKLAREWLF